MPQLSVIVPTFNETDNVVELRNRVAIALEGVDWEMIFVDDDSPDGTARALRAGTVYVNCYDADDITVPFGGFKQSGTGRDKSLHAFDKYTELKTTWIDLSQ